MIKTSLITMETSCETNESRDHAIALVSISIKLLNEYKPITSEMRDNKIHSIALLNQVYTLLVEYI